VKKHIRFRRGLDAYKHGTSHHLPVELAEMYIKAGVAEEVDSVPAKPVVEPVKDDPPAVETKEEPAADEPEADATEVETDDDTTKTTSRRRRKS
jgi:hypothetical protein